MENHNQFVTIDFEFQYQGRYDTPCAVGMVKVIDGVIVAKYYTLIHQPEMDVPLAPNNAITPQMTAHAPTYDKVYREIVDFIGVLPLVAHNASTEHKVLADTPHPDHLPRLADRAFFDTCLATGQRGLADLCQEYGIPLDHHNALSDAEACAEVYMRLCGGQISKGEVRTFKKSTDYKQWITADSKEADSYGSLPESEWMRTDSPLRGKHVVVSGEYSLWTDRADLRRQLMRLGAIVDKGVVNATEVIVSGSIKPAGPSKTKKVIERGGIILTEMEVALLLK